MSSSSSSSIEDILKAFSNYTDLNEPYPFTQNWNLDIYGTNGWNCNYSEVNVNGQVPQDAAVNSVAATKGVISRLLTHCLTANRAAIDALKAGTAVIGDLYITGKTNLSGGPIERVVDFTGTQTMRYNLSYPKVTGNESFLMGIQDFNMAGTQLQYNNDFGSFRVGTIDNSLFWNLSNLGLNTFSSGLNTIASGNQSAVFGENNSLINGTNSSIVSGSNNLINATVGSSTNAISSLIGGNYNDMDIINYSTLIATNVKGQMTNSTVLGGTIENISTAPPIYVGQGSENLSSTTPTITGPINGSFLLTDGNPNAYIALDQDNTNKQLFKNGYIRAHGSNKIGYGDDGPNEIYKAFEAYIPGSDTSFFDFPIPPDALTSFTCSVLVVGINPDYDPFDPTNKPYYLRTLQIITEASAFRQTTPVNLVQLETLGTITQEYSNPVGWTNVGSVFCSVNGTNFRVEVRNDSTNQVKVHINAYLHILRFNGLTAN